MRPKRGHRRYPRSGVGYSGCLEQIESARRRAWRRRPGWHAQMGEAAYAHVYDLPRAALDRIAYYFSFLYADGRQVEDYLAPLEEAVARWSSRPGALVAEDVDGAVEIVDEREAPVSSRYTLDGAEAWTLRACDDVMTTHRLEADAEKHLEWSLAEIGAAIAALQVKRLIVTDGDWHLALPVTRKAT